MYFLLFWLYLSRWCDYFCVVLHQLSFPQRQSFSADGSSHHVRSVWARSRTGRSRTGRSATGIVFDTIHCQGKLVQWAELEHHGWWRKRKDNEETDAVGKTGRRKMDREDDGVMQSCGKAVAGLREGIWEGQKTNRHEEKNGVNDGRGRVEAKREK